MGFRKWASNLKRMKKKKESGIHFGRQADASISDDAYVEGGTKLTFGCTWNAADHFPSYLSLASGSKLIIKDHFFFYSGTRVAIRGTLELGSGYINYGASIFCYEKIVIGNDVAIGSNVCIRDTDSHQIISQCNQIVNPVSSPVYIGDHVWIGEGSTILKGVRIGNESIVASGAVVTHDVPNNCVVAGVPAKVIKENTTWR